VLLVSPTLVPGRGFPAPVEFANALAAEGMSVFFAAAVGPLRTELSRAIRYFLVDDAEQAPVKTAHELSRLVSHHRPDVVHAHGARCAMVAALAVKASRVRCARVMTHLSSPRRFPRWIRSPLMKHCADCYFVATDALKSELESLGVPAERIRVESVDAGHAAVLARDSVAVYRDLVRSEDGA
jgi:hypothetical protein